MEQTFPAWFYGPDGEAAVFADAADVPKGWKDHPRDVDPLDHDGDGRKGGGPVPKRGRPKKAG